MVKKAEKKTTKVKVTPGVIKLNNVPHGFYEDEILKFFKQFGKVKHVKVARSKKTFKSKGFAFVMFHNVEAAKAAAESMHNYLLFDKVLKCRLIKPEYLPKNFFDKPKKWQLTTVELHKRKHNNFLISKEDEMKLVRKQYSLLKRRQKILKDMGIDFECHIINVPDFVSDTDSLRSLTSGSSNSGEPLSSDVVTSGSELNDYSSDDQGSEKIPKLVPIRRIEPKRVQTCPTIKDRLDEEEPEEVFEKWIKRRTAAKALRYMAMTSMKHFWVYNCANNFSMSERSNRSDK